MIKVLILGPSGSGKTTTLEHINNHENISILPFDYGKATIGKDTTYLFSSPGTEGFKFINDIMTPDVDGIIICVDNTIGITPTDKDIINLICKKHIPYVIFANKQDLNNSYLKIDFDAPVIPTIAAEGIGINDGLKMLLKSVGNTARQEYTTANPTENKNVGDFKDIAHSINVQCSKKPDFQELVKKIKASHSNNTQKAKICKLKIIMHPIELENVKKALENYGFTNITLTEIGYLNNVSLSKETYRASRYDITIPPKVQISMILKQEDVKYVIQALEPVKTEDIINDIFVYPVENVVRIRTEEKGEEAIE